MNCILSSQFINIIPKERHYALEVHLTLLLQTFNHFAWHFFPKVFLPILGMSEIKELKDSHNN
jgi:hypothetical protein